MELSLQSWVGMPRQERVTNGQQSQNGSQQRPPNTKGKLRESCNNCAISKVKCSKDRPTCKRCKDRAIFCQFSPSRRSGKRRRVPLSDCAAVESNTILSRSVSPLALEAHLDPVLELQSAWNKQHLEPENFEDSLKFGGYSFLKFDAETCQPDNPIYYGSGTDETTANNRHSRKGLASTNFVVIPDPRNRRGATLTPAFEIPPTVSDVDFPAQHSINNPIVGEFPIQCSHDCMTIALNVSQVLHTVHQTCTWFSPSLPYFPSHPSELDKILATNKEAIDLVSSILRCSCSLDKQLWLVLTLACSKIIARYGVVVWNESRSKEGSKQVPYSHKMTGECHADSLGGRRTTVQVVLSELYRVSELVGKLARRFLDSDSGQDGVGGTVEEGRQKWGNIPAGEKLETSMAIELETFLRNEVQSATKQAMEILRKN